MNREKVGKKWHEFDKTVLLSSLMKQIVVYVPDNLYQPILIFVSTIVRMKIGWMNRTKRSKLCYNCITIVIDETSWSVSY
jgi:hypothetical protein